MKQEAAVLIDVFLNVVLRRQEGQRAKQDDRHEQWNEKRGQLFGEIFVPHGLAVPFRYSLGVWP
ncbi:hypothetical protein D3C81_2161990 [compost metagenome]